MKKGKDKKTEPQTNQPPIWKNGSFKCRGVSEFQWITSTKLTQTFGKELFEINTGSLLA